MMVMLNNKIKMDMLNILIMFIVIEYVIFLRRNLFILKCDDCLYCIIKLNDLI